MFSERCRMQHVQKLRRYDHSETSARTEQRQRCDDERHPRVGVLCERQTEPTEQLLRAALLCLVEVLVANERWVPDGGVEQLLLRAAGQKPAQEVGVEDRR